MCTKIVQSMMYRQLCLHIALFYFLFYFSDVEADDEIAQPLLYHSEEDIPSTSGGGTSSSVAME